MLMWFRVHGHTSRRAVPGNQGSFGRMAVLYRGSAVRSRCEQACRLSSLGGMWVGRTDELLEEPAHGEGRHSSWYLLPFDKSKLIKYKGTNNSNFLVAVWLQFSVLAWKALWLPGTFRKRNSHCRIKKCSPPDCSSWPTHGESLQKDIKSSWDQFMRMKEL